ncbi:MAG TPA: hypothetical protein PLP95_10035 [Microthrixaceae bacterium]|nr:hypothetical protein [Microthrixaceae bacterium]
MALIRATCSDCGDVELRSRDIQVRICRDNGNGSYLFRCPVCRMTEVKSADDQIVDILVAAGVRCSEWQLPAELLERPGGDAITHDDVLDFHELLNSEHWYAELESLQG